MRKRRRVRFQDVAWALTLVFVLGVVLAAVVRFGFSVDLLIFMPFVLGGSAFFVWMARHEVWLREERWQMEIETLAEELKSERQRADELSAELERVRDQSG